MLQYFALQSLYVVEVHEMFIGAGAPKTNAQNNYHEQLWSINLKFR
jgi:hypothetical protein